jgi:cyclase
VTLPRVIPVLLLHEGGLVKTTRFGRPVYLGDPINIIKIFNDKAVDELVLLDIDATPAGRRPNTRFLAEVVEEAFVPLGYGGGVRTLEEMRDLFRLGIEKVIVNTAVHLTPELVRQAADQFGSQSVVVSMDVKRSWIGGARVVSHGGRRRTGYDPARFAAMAQELGAGELMVTSIDKDGSMSGYDLSLIKTVTSAVDIPVVACGGAARLEDFRLATEVGGASAVAAGSMFVFQGPHRAVLISFPDRRELERVLMHQGGEL